MRVLILVLFFALPCFGAESIKATGTARARIVAPEEVQISQPNTIVWTEANGATAQVVF